MEVNLFKVSSEKSDVEAIKKVLNRKDNWTIKGEVQELEGAVSKYVGVKYGVAFNSGTSALHALMLAYGIKRGDEVIVPSFTFISTANCVLFVGAIPVFADIEDKYYGLDPADVEKKITNKTKAIIAVHYGGGPCRIAELKKIAKKHKLILIEDACESLGAVYDYKMVGSFGDAAVFSFCQNKIITAGEGGMVVTSDKKLAGKLRKICDHGKEDGEFVSLGFNWRMSNLTGAVALSQFKRIETIIQKRIQNVRYFNKVQGFANEPITKDRNVYQLYTINLGYKKTKIKKLLDKYKIGNKTYFEPVHQTPFYKSLGYADRLPVTERISKEVLTLPMYPDLTRREMDYISDVIWKKTI